MKPSVVVGLVAVAGLVGAGVVAVAGGDVSTPEAAEAAGAPPEREPVLVDVERMVLADEVITRGSVVSAGAIEYTPPSSSGGAVVTEVLRDPGELVNAGDVIAIVDGRPVFVLEGAQDLGSDITPLSKGPDVARLQSALRGLGFEIPSGEDNVVGEATQRAIRQMFEDSGFRVSTTAEPPGVGAATGGGESLEAKLSRLRRAVRDAQSALAAAQTSAANQSDQVRTAELGVTAAQRRVREAEAARGAQVGAALETLAAAREAERAAASTTTSSVPGDARLGGAGGVSAVRQAEIALADAQRTGDASVAEAFAQLELAHVQLDEARRLAATSGASATQQVQLAQSTLDAAREQLVEATSRDGVILQRSDVVFVPKLPTTVLSTSSSTAGASGALGGPGVAGPIFSLSSGELVLDVSVPTGAGVEPGAKGVADSDDGRTVLEIEAESPEGPAGGAAAGSEGDSMGSQGDSTYRFAITSTTKGEAVAGMNLRVTVSLPTTDAEVIAVPVRALRTGSGGSTYVELAVDAGGEEFVAVPVEVGRSGGGMVELVPVDPSEPLGLEPGDRVRVS